MSWDLRLVKESEAMLKKFLAEQVPLLRKDSFKEAAGIFFKKLLKTYREIDMRYFRDVKVVPGDIELLPEWVDFFVEGACVAHPQKSFPGVGSSSGEPGDTAPDVSEAR